MVFLRGRLPQRLLAFAECTHVTECDNSAPFGLERATERPQEKLQKLPNIESVRISPGCSVGNGTFHLSVISFFNIQGPSYAIQCPTYLDIYCKCQYSSWLDQFMEMVPVVVDKGKEMDEEKDRVVDKEKEIDKEKDREVDEDKNLCEGNIANCFQDPSLISDFF